MKRVFSFCIVLMAAILCLGAQQGTEKREWSYFGSTPVTGDQFFFDVSSVKRGTGETVSVNIKKVVKDPQPTIRMRTAQGQSVKGYDRLDNIQALWELDCKGARVATTSETHYDRDGKVLEHRSFQKKEWSPISADSLADQLKGKVCGIAVK